jgi:hypothetical protein
MSLIRWQAPGDGAGRGALCPLLRRIALVGALASVVLAGIAALATSALASSVALDAPDNGSSPLMVERR